MSKTDLGLGVQLAKVVRCGELNEELEYRLGMGLCWRLIVGVSGASLTTEPSFMSMSPNESVEKLALCRNWRLGAFPMLDLLVSSCCLLSPSCSCVPGSVSMVVS